MTDAERAALADELALIGCTDEEITTLLTRPEPCCRPGRCCARHWSARCRVVAARLLDLDRRTDRKPSR